jgi:hypothetical protein
MVVGGLAFAGLVVLVTMVLWFQVWAAWTPMARPLRAKVSAATLVATPYPFFAVDVLPRSTTDPLDVPRAFEPATARKAGGAVLQFKGELIIDSTPKQADVFVNQQRVGATPLRLMVRAGSHVIRMEQNGYERWSQAVLVAADQRTRVNARLQRSSGRGTEVIATTGRNARTP